MLARKRAYLRASRQGFAHARLGLECMNKSGMYAPACDMAVVALASEKLELRERTLPDAE